MISWILVAKLGWVLYREAVHYLDTAEPLNRGHTGSLVGVLYRGVSFIQRSSDTVEPLNGGHTGSLVSVLHREIVLYSEVE